MRILAHDLIFLVEDDLLSPFSEDAGGDPFDLSDIGVEQAQFIRITDVLGDEVVFDLDAVAVPHPVAAAASEEVVVPAAVVVADVEFRNWKQGERIIP